MNWHLISKEETLRLIGSNETGLSSLEASARLEKYGPNLLQEKQQKPVWLIFLAQFKDVMILILAAAAVISGLLGEMTDTIVILIIVGLNALVGFVQEYRAAKAVEALKKMSAPTAKVLRNGTTEQLPSAELVIGDLVLLEAGTMIPADLRLLDVHSLRMEEASLTGESLATDKQTSELIAGEWAIGDRSNMAYKGTIATYGRGRGVVVATGMDTEIGRIAQLLQEDESMTPLQKRLADFGKKLSFAILGICLVIYVTGLLRGEDPVRMLLTAISVAVAGIPEALPAVVTIALALGARKMVQKNALIRRLPAVETLGSVTYICTDKTGTLTQNRMSVVETWSGAAPTNDLFSTSAETLWHCMALNHDVVKNESGEWVGEPTELALAVFANQQLPGFKATEFERAAEVPFDSVRKMMTTVHRLPNREDYLVVAKGALESVLAACDDPDQLDMGLEAERMGNAGLRVIAYACRLIEELPIEKEFNSLEKGLQVCGLVGLMDPARLEAAQAIQDCRTAGIVPVMITGDHFATAQAIAKQIGIIAEPSDKIVTGQALQAMPPSVFERDIEQIKVYARVSPEQKLQIVKALQAKGHYVAVTGDGVNDAPALRRANIGIAMGITGTDVSKEAAHMILLDDNFATIVRAVREGRRIFENIRKFIKYILTGNSGEIWTIFLAPLAGLPLPLLPIHILWINLVTDGLPSLALTNEPAEKDLMKLPPRKPNESIMANGLGFHILWVGLLMAAICLGTQAYSIAQDDPKWQTYVFTILCFSQMGHVMAIRSERFFLFKQGIFTNPALIGAVLLTFLGQMAIIYVPALQAVFSTQALTWKELLTCVLLSLLVFHAVELEKLVKMLRSKRNAKITRTV